MQKTKRVVYKLILFFFILAQFQFVSYLNLPSFTIPGTSVQLNPQNISLLNPAPIDSAGLSSASATLSNPRLSFFGRTAAAYSAGQTAITLGTPSNVVGDINTNNLFPNDSVSIKNSGIIPVASISSSTVFTLKNALPVATGNGDSVYATQSGTLTLNFYTGAAVPAGGSVLVKIPAALAAAPEISPTDGRPDTGNSIANNGFDTNTMTNANITCPAGFTAGTYTAATTGGAANPHLFSCNTASTIPAGANFTITIGTGGKLLINPAPINTAHTQGTADIYGIDISTTNSSNGAGTILENIEVKTAPIEGVLVTASVDETLSFTIAGVTADSGSACGITRDASSPDSTATSVPWGVINSDYTNNVNRHNANQTLTVTTNAPTGYTVYAEENDQMGKDGAACSGAAPSVEPYTYTGPTSCIRDYDKGGASSVTPIAWTATPGTDYGFGYSLEDISGTDAYFEHDDSGVFYAKHFADQENSQSKYAAGAQVMSNTGPVSGSQIYVCYRIHVPATQPAGYYYNKLKYTAVAKF